MHEVKVCPCCGGETWNNLFTMTDHSITQESFNLITCTSCGLVATSPRPADNKLGDYYKSEKYISHSGTSQGLVNQLYLRARKIALNWKYQIINELHPSGKLLDFGCGTGEFMHHMKTKGWQVTGMEPSDDARAKAESLSQTQIFKTEESISGKYDVITLWHVLEHLPEPNRTMEKLKAVLNDSGTLLIAVPNHWSFDGQHYGPHWAGYDVPRHLWHFNQKAMVLFLQKHGLHVKQILPMKLDAYYVSMLSEKYKKVGGLMALLKGVWYGFHSNLGARKTGEYSSLIYIATK